MKRRDTLTMDLFDEATVPSVTVGYEERIAGHGALSNRIARLVSKALRDAPSGVKRKDVSAKMSAYLGRSVSPAMVDKWASESSGDHRIPLDAFAALIEVTEAHDLLGFLPEMFGYVVVPERYAGLVRLHLIREKKDRLAQLEASEEAKWRARR